MIEIERKYLVVGEFLHLTENPVKIIQGYLFSTPEKNLRVRISDTRAFLNIKAGLTDSVISRFEWEIEIRKEEAEELLKLCGDSYIEKERYKVNYENQLIEIDVFKGKNSGLVIAEIEIESENTIVLKPSWLGDEVTYDKRYFNSELAINPYLKWR